MTTGGEGGMLITDDGVIWDAVWAYKDHGKSYDSVFNKVHPPGFRWLHDSLGTNGRMTEMQAAIGRIQLRKLAVWVELRRRNAAILTECLAALDAIRVTVPPPEVYHSYYKYYAFVRPERLKPGWDRDRIMQAINVAGVPCFTGSCSEVYLERAFSIPDLKQNNRSPIARELGETSLMFLVHPTLSEHAMHAMAEVIEKILREAGR